jgi:hypothetical protein
MRMRSISNGQAYDEDGRRGKRGQSKELDERDERYGIRKRERNKKRGILQRREI